MVPSGEGDAEHRRLDPRRWSLAARVVSVTIVMAMVSILGVGAYLSSVIAEGLFEQRQERVLDESASLRSGLIGRLQQSVGTTSTQQRDSATEFITTVRQDSDGSGRQAALVPVDSTGGIVPISTDRDVLGLVQEQAGDDFAAAITEEPDALTYRSVALDGEDGRQEPGILVGTRVTVPGSGSYDFYLVYSLGEEQRTLAFVQRVMIGGFAVLLALMVGVAFVVSKLVTVPLQRAASAAERLAEGDLTSRVEVQGGDELARVGESFNDMAQSLEQKVQDLTELSHVQQRFVSDVSHELRTPLTTIRMATSVLEARREDFAPEIARTTELLSAQVRRFDTLLADLLEISRFDSGAAMLEARREDMDALVRSAIDDIRPLAGSQGVVIRLDQSGDADAVVDRRRIDRILRNLLTNAIEHGAGHPVHVQTGADHDAVAVVVQDFGHGISPQDASRVFERFWRADPSRARTLGGTGLGLAISAEDAHLHGGWLQAWGSPGEGAVFRLTVPRRPGAPLRRSPVPLERPFTLVEPSSGEGAAAPCPLSEPVPVRPDDLPVIDPEEDR
ncbi:MtrAB system histidine kinase MtrB [Brachybacterium phenoliresistens]|uniref:MtrAB system histidine kinase MtrB n=1 Tax=Brachybacterium phenoliresistens TaxID=396014 RepID=UPI0004B17BEF|nr:MtrAB system histidine kinase MtrB [Brachybacterium phenoliresistens]